MLLQLKTVFLSYLPHSSFEQQPGMDLNVMILLHREECQWSRIGFSVVIAGGRSSIWVPEVGYYVLYSLNTLRLFWKGKPNWKPSVVILRYIIWNVEILCKISIHYWNSSQKWILLEIYSFHLSSLQFWNLTLRYLSSFYKLNFPAQIRVAVTVLFHIPFLVLALDVHEQ